MNFERGKDPIKSLNIGMDYRNRTPQVGSPFLVHFRLRKSCPEYYPLQNKEKNGESIIAICLKEPSTIYYNPYTFEPLPGMKCRIGDDPDMEFHATQDAEGYWEIS